MNLVVPQQSDWTPRKKGDRFTNLDTDYRPGLKEVLRWKLRLGPTESVPSPSSFKSYEARHGQPDFEAIHSPEADRVVATWVGHSTFLLQIGGLNFLTDPHFGSHCSPVPLPAFRRRTEPGLRVGQLPKIDAILLGHNHYDHLDLPSLRAVGPGTVIFCPAGVGQMLEGLGAKRIVELSWGETAKLGETELICLPTQHGSARTPFDRNASLWCGWLVKSSERKVAFLSDTAYSPIFKAIGQRFGPIDLAMIPIGAYRPAWFMRPLHLDPAEAVQVHLELKANQSVAMHWGTFQLADDPLGEPPMLLEKARQTAGVNPEAFRVMNLGETLKV